jgi:hypothetical protein
VTQPAPSTTERGYLGHGQAAGDAAYWWSQLEFDEPPDLRWPYNLVAYDRMYLKDAQVRSVLNAVALPVLRTTWRIDPVDAREDVVALVAEDLGLPLIGEQPSATPMQGPHRFSWQEHVRQALLMLRYGFMPFEQVYREDRQVRGPGRFRLRKLAARMPRTIEKINQARDGGLVSIEQRPLDGVRPVPIPVRDLVMYVHDQEPGSWRGNSVLHAAYVNWRLKDVGQRVWLQGLQRQGMGVTVYKASEQPDPVKADIELGAGTDAGAGIPHGADLDLKGVRGTTVDPEKHVRYQDEQIARAVLAHFLNLGTQTGSWALGSTFADFFTLSLQALGEHVAGIATQHIVRDLVAVNYGEAEPAPRLVFDEIGSRNAATAEAIDLLVRSKVVIPDRDLEQFVRRSFALPPKTVPSPSVPGQPPGATNSTVEDQQQGATS